MPKVGPKWKPADYTPFYLIEEPTHSQREIRAEYSRLRTQLLHRAERLEKAGIASAQVKFLKESLPTIKEITERNATSPMTVGRKKIPLTLEREIAERLSQARSMELERGYSLAGIKEIQKTINKETGEIVPLGEVLSFSEYMKSWRTSAFYKTIVGSGEAAGYHDEEYQEIGGSFTDFYTLFKSEEYGA